MERLFLECSVRAALLVGATAILLYAMQVRAAAARHSVWAGVVALMLLLPIWTAWGPKASFRVLPPLPQGIAHTSKVQIETFSTPAVRSTVVSPSLKVLLGVYLLGLALLLFRLAIGTFRAGRLIRNAVLNDGVRTSSLCAAPVTVGLLHPKVIFPENWRQWHQAQRDVVLTHEYEHVRCRHPLVRWLALLNRALFWFHPVAWWLEHHLSTLAEEACDNAVLARGYDPRIYSECLIDMARSVRRSGVRVNIAGLAMPGSSLRRRIRRILEGGPVPRTSRRRMAAVCFACAISCTAIAAGTLGHAQPNSAAEQIAGPGNSASAAHPATKFALDDLKIEGDVHDQEGVRERVLNAWKSRDYDNVKELADEGAERVRADFQERGYFQAVVHDPSSQPLGLTPDGKQNILIITPVSEGDQFRLRTITIQNTAPDHTLNISEATLRDQFHLRDGDLFDTTEIRGGLNRMRELYVKGGYAEAVLWPDTKIDSTSHRIDLTIRITEVAPTQHAMVDAPQSGTGTLRREAEILSDTQGVDFGPYMRQAMKMIGKLWVPLRPEEIEPAKKAQNEAVIRFTIGRDGAISDMVLVQSAHLIELDRAAWGSITGAGSFPSLPADFNGPNLILRVGFKVNPPQQ